MPEYSQEQVMLGMATNAHYQIKSAENLILRVVDQLQDALDNFNGSAERNDSIEQKQEFITGLESQVQIMQSHFKDCKAVYKQVSGKTWTLPAKRSEMDKTATQAAEDAKALIAKYKK